MTHDSLKDILLPKDKSSLIALLSKFPEQEVNITMLFENCEYQIDQLFLLPSNVKYITFGKNSANTLTLLRTTMLGIICFEKRQYTQARQMFDKSIEVDSADYYAYFYLGQINLENSLELSLKALNLKKDFMMALVFLAKYYIQQKKPTEAWEYLKKAMLHYDGNDREGFFRSHFETFLHLFFCKTLPEHLQLQAICHFVQNHCGICLERAPLRGLLALQASENNRVFQCYHSQCLFKLGVYNPSKSRMHPATGREYVDIFKL